MPNPDNKEEGPHASFLQRLWTSQRKPMGFLCVKCNNRATMYTIDRTDGWRPQIFKYEMDLEDKDYVPTESQSDVECEESMQDLMMEAKELWDRVWAYCADCGVRGDVYLRCEMCYRNEPNNGDGYSSQEECHEK